MKLTNEMKNKIATGLIKLAYKDKIEEFEKRHKALLEKLVDQKLGKHQKTLITKLGKPFIDSVLTKNVEFSLKVNNENILLPHLRFKKYGFNYSHPILGKADTTITFPLYADHFTIINSVCVPKNKRDEAAVAKYVKEYRLFKEEANKRIAEIRSVVGGCSTDKKLIELIPSSAQFIETTSTNLPVSVETLNSINSIVNGGK